MVAQPEIQLRIPPAQVGIKGDAQLRLIDPREGQPVIGDEHPRLGAVVPLEPADFLPDLAEAAVRQLTRQKGRGLVGPHGDAALIHHAVILFLDLDKDAPAIRRDAVAAHAQLFLIRRLFERRADEPPVVRIIIEAADRVAAVHVAPDVRCDALEQSRLLLRREKILLLIACKAVLCGIGHVGGLLSAGRIPPPPKENLKKISVFPLGSL